MQQIVQKKRGRGRPPTGRMTAIQLKLPAEILERLDRVADNRFETRATVIRSYILRGLTADMQGK